MRNALLPVAALLTGCNNLTGIWLFDIPFQESSDNCSTSITENFSAGYVPQAGAPGVSDWVFTDEYTGNDAVAFGQIETYGNDLAVLVIGTEVYPGTKDGKDWVFEWSDSEEVSEKQEHYAGSAIDYGYLREDVVVSTVTYVFSLNGRNSAAVSVESTGTTTTTWYESDAWSGDLSLEIGEVGQIPSDEYLVFDNITGDTDPQENYYDASDCDSDVCELRIETSCSDDGEFTAYRTDFEDEDHYGSMRESGQ